MFGVLHALPWLGITAGQGAAVGGGLSQNQTGVPRGWPPHRAQGGPGGPGLQVHGTQEQRAAGG
jgi:hypothetical protein